MTETFIQLLTSDLFSFKIFDKFLYSNFLLSIFSFALVVVRELPIRAMNELRVVCFIIQEWKASSKEMLTMPSVFPNCCCHLSSFFLLLIPSYLYVYDSDTRSAYYISSF